MVNERKGEERREISAKPVGSHVHPGSSGNSEAAIDEYLQKLDLYRKPIAKDGSCLFRAIAEQVYSTQSKHLNVRRECIDFMRRNKETFQGFVEGPFEHHLFNLQNPKEWAGQVEISALSLLYKKDIVVYQNVNQPPITVTANGFEDKILLCFSNGNHYDCIYSKKYRDHAAMAQSILYELLYKSVFPEIKERDSLKDDISESNDSGFVDENGNGWTEVKVKGGKGRNDEDNHPALHDSPENRIYMWEIQRSMDSTVYRNVELEIWEQSKKDQQLTDKTVATSLQFKTGGVCFARLKDFTSTDHYYKAYIDDIVENGSLYHIYVPEIKRKFHVPLEDLKPFVNNDKARQQMSYRDLPGYYRKEETAQNDFKRKGGRQNRRGFREEEVRQKDMGKKFDSKGESQMQGQNKLEMSRSDNSGYGQQRNQRDFQRRDRRDRRQVDNDNNKGYPRRDRRDNDRKVRPNDRDNRSTDGSPGVSPRSENYIRPGEKVTGNVFGVPKDVYEAKKEFEAPKCNETMGVYDLTSDKVKPKVAEVSESPAAFWSRMRTVTKKTDPLPIQKASSPDNIPKATNSIANASKLSTNTKTESNNSHIERETVTAEPATLAGNLSTQLPDKEQYKSNEESSSTSESNKAKFNTNISLNRTEINPESLEENQSDSMSYNSVTRSSENNSNYEEQIIYDSSGIRTDVNVSASRLNNIESTESDTSAEQFITCSSFEQDESTEHLSEDIFPSCYNKDETLSTSIEESINVHQNIVAEFKDLSISKNQEKIEFIECEDDSRPVSTSEIRDSPVESISAEEPDQSSESNQQIFTASTAATEELMETVDQEPQEQQGSEESSPLVFMDESGLTDMPCPHERIAVESEEVVQGVTVSYNEPKPVGKPEQRMKILTKDNKLIDIGIMKTDIENKDNDTEGVVKDSIPFDKINGEVDSDFESEGKTPEVNTDRKPKRVSFGHVTEISDGNDERISSTATVVTKNALLETPREGDIPLTNIPGVLPHPITFSTADGGPVSETIHFNGGMPVHGIAPSIMPILPPPLLGVNDAIHVPDRLSMEPDGRDLPDHVPTLRYFFNLGYQHFCIVQQQQAHGFVGMPVPPVLPPQMPPPHHVPLRFINPSDQPPMPEEYIPAGHAVPPFDPVPPRPFLPNDVATSTANQYEPPPRMRRGKGRGTSFHSPQTTWRPSQGNYVSNQYRQGRRNPNVNMNVQRHQIPFPYR